MKKEKDYEDYINVFISLIRKFDLNPSEALIYSYIHGFSIKKPEGEKGRWIDSYFCMSVDTLAEKLNITPQTVVDILSKLAGLESTNRFKKRQKKLLLEGIKETEINPLKFPILIVRENYKRSMRYYTVLSRELIKQHNATLCSENLNDTEKNIVQKSGTHRSENLNAIVQKSGTSITSNNTNNISTSSEEEDSIKQLINKEIQILFNGKIPFSDGYDDKILSFFNEYELTEDSVIAFLEYAYNLVEEKKGIKSFTNYFFGVITRSGTYEEFCRKQKSIYETRKKKEVKIIECPVCGRTFSSQEYKCPSCGFERMYWNDKSEILKETNKWNLKNEDTEKYNACEKELETLVIDSFSGDWFNPKILQEKQNQKLEILRKYYPERCEELLSVM